MKKNFYLTLAMKRSGHHAFINWLCSQNGDITHYNNVVGGWENSSLAIQSSPKKVYGDGKDLCVNIEDFDIDDFTKFNFTNFSNVKECKNFYKIVFVRDFKNWLSSCLKRREFSGVYRDVYESLNKDYINDRKDTKVSRIKLWEKHISLFEDNPNEFILVSYPKWVRDKEYRKGIADKLNLKFTDKGFEEISSFGKGSSFDGTSVTDGRELNVLSRYKCYEEDDEFKTLISEHQGIVEKSHKYL